MSTEGVGGKKSQKLVNVVCEWPLTLIWICKYRQSGPVALRYFLKYIHTYFCTLISVISTHIPYFLDYYNGVGCNSFPIQQGNLWNSKQHNFMEIKSLDMSTSSFKRSSTLCKLCYVGLSPTWRCCYHNVCGTPIHTGVFVFIFETFSLIMENFTLFWPSPWNGFHCSTSIRLWKIKGKKLIWT